MNCIFCTMSETQFDLAKKKHIPTKHPGDVTAIICSDCLQRLLSAGRDELDRAYQMAITHNVAKKADALKNFLREGKGTHEATRTNRPGVDRGRTMRTVRSTDYEIR